MKVVWVKFCIFCLSISILSSCKGQVKAKVDQMEESVSVQSPATMMDQSIWDIFQDSKGNYWFASKSNGVYMYDGEELKHFTRQDGLLTDAVRGIQEDEKGNIFIETANGVNKYDGTTITNLEVQRSFMNPWILNPTDLWFNCNGNAEHIYRYDGTSLYELKLPEQDLKSISNEHVENQRFSPYTVFGIDKDKEGNLWIGTSTGGAFRYDGSSFLWVGEKELLSLEDGRTPGVRSMLEDKDGNMWLSNFLFKYKVKSNNPTSYSKTKAVDLSDEILENYFPYFNSGLLDDDGILWMTSYGGGVWKYDGKELHNLEASDEGERLLCMKIIQDKDGMFWIGTDNKGVYGFDGERFEKKF